MIVKMTKYSFVLMHAETDTFLDELQKIGIIDISRSAKPVDETSSALYDKSDSLGKAIERIRTDDFTRDDEYVSLSTAYLKAGSEYESRLPWGAFSAAKVRELASLGYTLHFYEVSVKQFEKSSWAEEYPLQVIDNDGRTVRFVVVSTSAEYSFPIGEIPAPEGSFEDARAEMESLKVRLEERAEALRAEKELIPSMEEEREETLRRMQRHLDRAAGPLRRRMVERQLRTELSDRRDGLGFT